MSNSFGELACSQAVLDTVKDVMDKNDSVLSSILFPTIPLVPRPVIKPADDRFYFGRVPLPKTPDHYRTMDRRERVLTVVDENEAMIRRDRIAVKEPDAPDVSATNANVRNPIRVDEIKGGQLARANDRAAVNFDMRRSPLTDLNRLMAR